MTELQHEKTRPSDIEFNTLLRQWTEAVGRWVVWREFQERESGRVPHARIDGCWVDGGPGLIVRFTVNEQRFGLRLDRLDIDLLTGHPIAAGTSSDTASRQASNIYDGTLFGPDDGSPHWSDSSGRVWHGAEPGPGWAAVHLPAPGATVLLLDDEPL